MGYPPCGHLSGRATLRYFSRVGPWVGTRWVLEDAGPSESGLVAAISGLTLGVAVCGGSQGAGSCHLVFCRGDSRAPCEPTEF